MISLRKIESLSSNTYLFSHQASKTVSHENNQPTLLKSIHVRISALKIWVDVHFPLHLDA